MGVFELQVRLIDRMKGRWQRHIAFVKIVFRTRPFPFVHPGSEPVTAIDRLSTGLFVVSDPRCSASTVYGGDADSSDSHFK